MKGFIGTIIGICLLMIGGYIIADVCAHYEFERDIHSYWSLADKASSIEKKSEYLDQFVDALEKSRLAANDAVFFTTPDNSRDKNLEVLHSLQDRLHEIKQMDVSSLEYQQAMAQITAQEQGEAHHMLWTLEGCWYLSNHPMLWGWIEASALILFVLALVVALLGLAALWDN